eukprot:2910545-Lingulodinium_polyedra.AAC.1
MAPRDKPWPASATRFRACWNAVLGALRVPCQDALGATPALVRGGGAAAMFEAKRWPLHPRHLHSIAGIDLRHPGHSRTFPSGKPLDICKPI